MEVGLQKLMPRLIDDGASICETRIGEFVPVRISGSGIFTDGGNTFTTDADDIVYCRTAAGWTNTSALGGTGVELIFDVGSERIADSVGGLVETCWWKTGTPQPAECLP